MPLSASSDPPARTLGPSGPGALGPVPAPDGCPVERAAFWPASDARGAEVLAAAGAGTVPGVGVVALPRPAEETGAGVEGAGTCAGWAVCPCDAGCGGASETVGVGAAPEGGGDGFPGAVVRGVGEADGGGEAGQIFTGTSPAGAHGAAVAGNARASGEAASTKAATDVQQAFRVEFILPIVGFRRAQSGNPGPARPLFGTQKDDAHPGSTITCAAFNASSKWWHRGGLSRGRATCRLSGCVRFGTVQLGCPLIRTGPVLGDTP